MTGPAPHDLDAERSVLGALLLSERAMYALVLDEGLRSEDFYSQHHRHVFAAMRSLFDDGKPFDRLTVRAWLRDRGLFGDAGGEATLDDLGGPITAAGNVRQHAQIVRDRALQRRVLLLAAEVTEKARNGVPGEELVADLERGVLEIGHQQRQEPGEMVGKILEDEQAATLERQQSDEQIAGIPSGWKPLDDQTGGFQRGNLVIIAGRPAMGKSVEGLNLAEQFADQGYKTALFQLEMTKAEAAQRLMARRARVNLTDIRNGNLRESQWQRIVETNAALASAPLHIDPTRGLTITALKAKARQLAMRMGSLDIVIVDYLQQMPSSPGAENRTQAIGEISMGLKILAGELNAVVIALSQLSRQLETRGASVDSKKPQLSDLRESGHLEQDADIVQFVFRPPYYDAEADDPTEAEFIIAKARMGEIGTVPMSFLGEYQSFAPRRAERVPATAAEWRTSS